jgi:hypothetical protein
MTSLTLVLDRIDWQAFANTIINLPSAESVFSAQGLSHTVMCIFCKEMDLNAFSLILGNNSLLI